MFIRGDLVVFGEYEAIIVKVLAEGDYLIQTGNGLLQHALDHELTGVPLSKFQEGPPWANFQEILRSDSPSPLIF